MLTGRIAARLLIRASLGSQHRPGGPDPNERTAPGGGRRGGRPAHRSVFVRLSTPRPTQTGGGGAEPTVAAGALASTGVASPSRRTWARASGYYGTPATSSSTSQLRAAAPVPFVNE